MRQGDIAEQLLGSFRLLWASDGRERQWVANSHILDNLPKAKLFSHRRKGFDMFAM